MTRVWRFILLLKFIQGLVNAEGDDAYEYEYADSGELNITGGGQRLVGAKRADVNKIPFLAAYNFDDNTENVFSSCTGSLIAKRWILSAAHCILGNVDLQDIPACVDETKTKGQFTKTKVLMNPYNQQPLSKTYINKCYYTAGGHVKIHPVSPAGQAFLGATDQHNQEDVEQMKKIKIDYFIRHAQSYRGGGNYGNYGGYDITLLHLAEDAEAECSTCPKPESACLPRPSFKDAALGTLYRRRGASLAGFGKYTRKACQTDEYGKSKYHYCSTQEGQAAQCQTTQPPIPKVCQDFLEDPTTPSILPDHLTEFVVTDKATGKNHYCTRSSSPKPGSKGWCWVQKDASKFMGQKVKSDQSWGFCSKDCYLTNEMEEQHSVLREINNVDTLDEKTCKTYLMNSLPNGVKTEVMPEILCIGKLEEIKYEQWLKSGNKYSKKNEKMQDHKMAITKGQNWYVRSAGTCSGDSGGPVFVSQQSKHIVLGVVSGGRGGLRDCGGVNNPTHYARVKAFGPWITQMLGPDADEVCWFDIRGLERRKPSRLVTAEPTRPVTTARPTPPVTTVRPTPVAATIPTQQPAASETSRSVTELPKVVPRTTQRPKTTTRRTRIVSSQPRGFTPRGLRKNTHKWSALRRNKNHKWAAKRNKNHRWAAKRNKNHRWSALGKK